MANQFQDRIDMLAIAYIQEHYDIKAMTPQEFLRVFNEVCNQLIDAYQGG